MKKLPFIVGIFLFGLLLASSVIIVDTDEVAVVYRFGAIHRVVSPGLSAQLPNPIEHSERLEVTKIRTIELEQIRLLTADFNLVELKPVLQYTIQDPQIYVLSYAEPDKVLQQLVEAVIATTMARSQIDSETFLKRALLQQRIIQQLRVDLDAIQMGIQVVAFELRELSAPSAVVDAFNEVSSARGDKDTMILSAQSYASKRIPDIRGQAKGTIEAAHGQAAQIRSEASIRIAHYRSLLDSYQKAPKAIRNQLRQESWEKIVGSATVLQSTERTQLIFNHSLELKRP